ncbi:toll/interleukin-1 receptor domain-containing protein [Aeromonas hydrophila]
MSTPKVFISYSHDSPDHKKWVLELATRLRNNGVDAIIDQWELRPGDDLPHFMETHLASANYVIMICTDKYVQKANSGAGGVGYEKMIVTAELLSNIDSNKIVPVIRQFGTCNVPIFLKTKLFVNLSDDDEFNFDELVRTFHGAPLYKKPEIGNNPFTPVSETPPEKNGDPVREVMKMIIADFERGRDISDYRSLLQSAKMSRIMFDLILDEAVSNRYIRRTIRNDIILESEGKKYAVQHKIIN